MWLALSSVSHQPIKLFLEYNVLSLEGAFIYIGLFHMSERKGTRVPY